MKRRTKIVLSYHVVLKKWHSQSAICFTFPLKIELGEIKTIGISKLLGILQLSKWQMVFHAVYFYLGRIA